jgi:hypothetical protein
MSWLVLFSSSFSKKPLVLVLIFFIWKEPFELRKIDRPLHAFPNLVLHIFGFPILNFSKQNLKRVWFQTISNSTYLHLAQNWRFSNYWHCTTMKRPPHTPSMIVIMILRYDFLLFLFFPIWWSLYTCLSCVCDLHFWWLYFCKIRYDGVVHKLLWPYTSVNMVCIPT